MGILDQVTGALGGGKGAGGGGVTGSLVQQLVGMLSKPGALGNLKSSFQQNGLGDVLQSWIGSGENKPISPSQVEQVLGRDTLDDMAKQAGVDEPQAANEMSGLLPDLIDRISPDGQEPSSDKLGGMLSSLGKMFH